MRELVRKERYLLLPKETAYALSISLQVIHLLENRLLQRS